MKIRPANLNDSPALARIQVGSYRHTYAPILPATYMAHFTLEEQEADWHELLSAGMDELLLVAENQVGQVVGYALAGPDRADDMPYDGELIALHVLQPYQRQRVGTHLFSVACASLQQQGCASLFLWVLEANPARQFYQKLGGQRFNRKPWPNNAYYGTDIYEVAYGWESMQPLLALTEGSGQS